MFTAWTFEPWVVVLLGLGLLLPGVGAMRVWRYAGLGHGVRASHVAAYAAGWLAVAVALVSPLDSLGATRFSAHMIQHELLMVVAAPLFVLARPLGAFAWALPAGWSRRIGAFFHTRAWRAFWRVLTGALGAWLLHAVAIWGWHLPALFDAALRGEGVHVLQHASFFVSALVYWWSVLGAGSRERAGVALLSLFTTMVHTGALGALLTFSRTVWYAYDGVDVAEDQQLGGLIMWIPGGLAYVVAMLGVAGSALASPVPRCRQAPSQTCQSEERSGEESRRIDAAAS